MNRLDLTGLTTRPAQVWGGVRLVPLVRGAPVEGLRLHREVYEGLGAGLVELGPRSHYVSYIPHGLVADWSSGGESGVPGSGGQSAAYGTQLGGGQDAPRTVRLPRPAHHRMAKRRPGDRLRFLPLHLALEGYLALHFGGPSTAWEEWSRRALRDGLSPRAEDAYLGWSVRGLGDALRIFEIHPDQCGVMVYVSDALAAAFVVPHPEDYRLLHASLVEDLYGELVHQYALYGAPVAEFGARLGDGAHIVTLADLRAAARGGRSGRGRRRTGPCSRGSCWIPRTASTGCTGWGRSRCGGSCRRSSGTGAGSTSGRRSPTTRGGSPT